MSAFPKGCYKVTVPQLSNHRVPCNNRISLYLLTPANEVWGTCLSFCPWDGGWLPSMPHDHGVRGLHPGGCASGGGGLHPEVGGLHPGGRMGSVSRGKGVCPTSPRWNWKTGGTHPTGMLSCSVESLQLSRK